MLNAAKGYPLAGHSSEWFLGREGQRRHRQRHYEVKEVAFDCSDPYDPRLLARSKAYSPASCSDKPNLLSAGGDGYVQIWSRPQAEDVMMVDGVENQKPSGRLQLWADEEADGRKLPNVCVPFSC